MIELTKSQSENITESLKETEKIINALKEKCKCRDCKDLINALDKWLDGFRVYEETVILDEGRIDVNSLDPVSYQTVTRMRITEGSKVKFVRDVFGAIKTHNELKIVERAYEEEDGLITHGHSGFQVMPKDVKNYDSLEDRLNAGLFCLGIIRTSVHE